MGDEEQQHKELHREQREERNIVSEFAVSHGIRQADFNQPISYSPIPLARPQICSSSLPQTTPNASHATAVTGNNIIEVANNDSWEGPSSNSNVEAKSLKPKSNKPSRRNSIKLQTNEMISSDIFLKPKPYILVKRLKRMVTPMHQMQVRPNARLLIKESALGHFCLPLNSMPPPPPRLCNTPSVRPGFMPKPQPEDAKKCMHNYGTCLVIEKPFKFVNLVPLQDEVRAPMVLAYALSNIRTSWEFTQNYDHCNSQLKSIRYDLIVQGVRSPLLINVYECHLKLAMYAGDYTQFVICMKQLIELYKEMPRYTTNVNEFVAYRILFNIYIKNHEDTKVVFAALTEVQKRDSIIRFAIKFRAMWVACNYKDLFKMYRQSPHYGYCIYILDWFIDRERKQYFKYLIKRCAELPVPEVTKELVFHSHQQTLDFLKDLPITYTDSFQYVIDCTNSRGHLLTIL